MKGTVLTVDLTASEAIISGDDGIRYTFGVADWNEKHPPVKGQRVDYVAADGQRATEVYFDAGTPAAPSGSWAAASPAPGWPEGLDERYQGLYCSTDDKVLIGFCGGLAHRFGLDTGYVRAGMLLLGLFVLWIPYLIGFFLPRLPTRGISRPR